MSEKKESECNVGATTTTTASGGGLFGSSATTGGSLFGAAAKPTTGGLFGSTGTSTFGAPASTAPSTGLFGAKPATGFGATSTGGGLFGSTTPAFGQQPTSTAFGQPASTSGGLFGNKPAFGATTTSTAGGGLFGSSQPASGGLFGAKPATFGAPASSGGLFGGTSTAPAFGSTATSTSLFGNTAAKPGGLFGSTQPATGGGLFGSMGTGATPFGAGTTGGLFGSTAAKPGGFSFGSAPTAPASGVFGATAGGPAQPAQLTLNPDAEARAAFQNQLEYLASAPYGDVLKPLKPLSTQASKTTDPVAHSQIINSGAGERMKASGSLFQSPRGASAILRSAPRIANSPRILGGLNRSASLRNTPSSNKSIFADLEAETTIMKEGFVPRRNVKKLVLTLKQRENKSGNATVEMAESSSLVSQSGAEESGADEEPPALLPRDTAASVLSPPVEPRPLRTSFAGLQDAIAPQPRRTPVTRLQERLDESTASSLGNGSIMNESLRGMGDGGNVSGGGGTAATGEAERQPSPPPDNPAGVKLTREGYYTVPELPELQSLVGSDGSCIVQDGFTVGRVGYGSVFWPGQMDVAGLDLDEIVHFRLKEVTVYPDESRKPPEGKELNRPAEVTLEGVWPRDKRSGEPVRSAERLEALGWRERLEAASAKMGAAFLDFRPATGAWVFRVPHFSKYGLELEDDAEPPPIPVSLHSYSSPSSS